MIGHHDSCSDMDSTVSKMILGVNFWVNLHRVLPQSMISAIASSCESLVGTHELQAFYLT